MKGFLRYNIYLGKQYSLCFFTPPFPQLLMLSMTLQGVKYPFVSWSQLFSLLRNVYWYFISLILLIFLALVPLTALSVHPICCCSWNMCPVLLSKNNSKFNGTTHHITSDFTTSKPSSGGCVWWCFVSCSAFTVGHSLFLF